MENMIRFELVKPVYYRRRQCHICDGYTDKNDFLCESKEGPFWYTRICKTCLEAGEFDERLKENIQQFREYADVLETMVGRIDAPTYKEWQAAEAAEFPFPDGMDTCLTTRVPDGVYKVIVRVATVRYNPERTGKELFLKMEICRGDYNGEVVSETIKFLDPDGRVQRFGIDLVNKIRSVCRLEQIDSVPPVISVDAELPGKFFCIKIVTDRFTSNRTGQEMTERVINNYTPCLEEKPTKSAW